MLLDLALRTGAATSGTPPRLNVRLMLSESPALPRRFAVAAAAAACDCMPTRAAGTEKVCRKSSMATVSIASTVAALVYGTSSKKRPSVW